jgi:hypothetical protein
MAVDSMEKNGSVRDHFAAGFQLASRAVKKRNWAFQMMQHIRERNHVKAVCVSAPVSVASPDSPLSWSPASQFAFLRGRPRWSTRER